ARVGPHVQKAGAIGAAAHAVIASAERSANDDGQLGNGGGGYRCDHFGAMAGNAFVFVAAPHHEAGNVLQEKQGNLALAAEFDEVGAFLGGFGEQDAIVGDNAYGHAMEVGKAGDQRGPEACLEFFKFRAVYQTGDDFADVVGLAGIGRDDAVELLRIVQGFGNAAQGDGNLFFQIEPCNGLAGQVQCMGIIFCQVISHARQAGVDIATAEIFGTDFFARCGLDQGRTPQKNGALVSDDAGFVAHG